jgi:predicted house-cleaning noncanonical NTP pyrophosphatase (MazG superfamily)
MTAHEKLVRDKIPLIIRDKGDNPAIRVAGLDEYALLLRDKLREEVGEFLETDERGELVDILEVVYALAATLGYSPVQMEQDRRTKLATAGGFEHRIVWSGNY